MAQSILIGPVPGLPAMDSITFIITQILDRVQDGVMLFTLLAESFAKNENKGIMLVHVKAHGEEMIDELFEPLASQTREASAEIGHEIPCRKIDRDFELGDNEGDVPCTPVVGPPKGPPTLHEHEPEPEGEREFLEPVDIAARAPDWWKEEG